MKFCIIDGKYFDVRRILVKKHTLTGNLILLLTAIIWGISFVSQRVGMEYIKPNTFNGIRSMLGALVLVPVILVREKTGKSNGAGGKRLLIGGIICGVLLCLASTLQTWGMVYTTSGKSGFITAMYMIFVPIIGLFIGKKIRPLTVLGIISGVVGMYLLSLGGSDLSLNKGDLLTLICAFVFSFHIMAIDRLSGEVDGVKLACLQFFVCGTINIILMLLFDHPDWSVVRSCTVPILYSGIMSCGVAYTLQIIGQRYTEPTPASIIMSLESVFAALAGWVLLQEALLPKEILGCVLMFAAIIVVQLPEKPRVEV